MCNSVPNLMIHLKLKRETYFQCSQVSCAGKLRIAASVQLSTDFFRHGATQPRNWYHTRKRWHIYENTLTNSTVANAELSADVNDPCETQRRNLLHTHTNTPAPGNSVLRALWNSVPSFTIMVQLNQETDNIHPNDDTRTRKLSAVADVQLSTELRDPFETQAWNFFPMFTNGMREETQYCSLRAT